MRLSVIVAAVIEKDGRFLFGRKARDEPPYPNKWCILGGHMNADESIEEALRREIMEEAGIEIEGIEPLGFSEDTGIKDGKDAHFIFLQFRCRLSGGEPRPGDDIAELKWAAEEELAGMDFSEPTWKLLSNIGLLK